MTKEGETVPDTVSGHRSCGKQPRKIFPPLKPLIKKVVKEESSKLRSLTPPTKN